MGLFLYPSVLDSAADRKTRPRCPQLPADANTLFRIPPESVPNWKEDEDEFECLNLHVTVPGNVKEGDNVPVLIWIYGGSFVVTVGSAESGVCGSHPPTTITSIANNTKIQQSSSPPRSQRGRP